MELIFTLFLLVYLVLLGRVRSLWNRIPCSELELDTNGLPGVSVIIPVRNEESNIESLLKSIARIQYPVDRFEVIIVDDASEDRTAELLLQHSGSNGVIRYFRLEEPQGFQGSYKKRALTHGVRISKNPIIITTDADCQFDPGWVKSMVVTMVNHDLAMVCGPVTYNEKKLLAQPLNIELACLVAIGAVSIYSGHPTMCNGANLCFLKSAFDTVNGYQGFEHIASGDDEFLLYKINKQFPSKVAFVKNHQAIVHTDPPATWVEFLNQRKRWSSKWKEHRSGMPRFLALFVFCFHLIITLTLLGTVFGLYSWRVLAVQLLTKLLLEYLLVRSVFKFLGKKPVFQWIFLMQFLYSFYVVIVSCAVQFFGFSWKNRKYQ